MQASLIDKILPSIVTVRVPNLNKHEQGSGIIINDEGWVITSSHLIGSNDTAEITFFDGEKIKASVLSQDEEADCAILQIKKNNLAPAKLGDSDKARIGEIVFALGNPFGFGISASQGIISGLSREFSEQNLANFMQTDAAINSGNSGGPLVNAKGEVIAMNTATIKPSEGNGIGFALPINSIKKFISDLAEFGKKQKLFLGIKMSPLSDDEEKAFGYGVKIIDVSQNSPAKDAGLQAGDILLSFNEKKLYDMKNVAQILKNARLGQSLPLTYARGKNLANTEILMKDEDDNQTKLFTSRKKGEAIEALGLKVLEIDDEVREIYNLPTDTQGLLVSSVKFGSSAFSKDIKNGDIIARVRNNIPHTISDLQDEVDSAQKNEAQNLLLLIENSYGTRFVELKI